jgi:glycosyltransferase involved in cell wall biosynthesis
MKLLVDGVFFRSNRPGINRIWSSILQRLVNYPELKIVMLDRGDCPVINGIQRIEFPSYTGTSTAAESFLIDRFCRDLEVDVFTSTHYTTPVTTPSVLMVYDMTAEVKRVDPNGRDQQEKQIAISFASYYACISHNTRSDLKRFYPTIHDHRAIVTYCGLDREVFQPRDRKRVDEFRRRFGIIRPYYLLVGLREGYKNAALLFDTARSMRKPKFEIVCVGGETEISVDAIAGLPSNVTVRRVDLTDDELACAYSGAEALVYPSLYEGFGMPVVEAMACGCPVITTKLGALGEVAGDAALFVSGHDRNELRRAIESVRDQTQRATLIDSGLSRAALYKWDDMARSFYSLLEKGYEERAKPSTQRFFQQWRKLRAIQADVDIET